MPESERKRKLWEVDTAAFQPMPKASGARRLFIEPAKRLGKFVLVGLALAYPILLVTVGLLFGGLAFWGSLAGSSLLIWFLLKRLGFARNFQSWDMSLLRVLPALCVAFLAAAGFYLGLFYLKIYVIPIAVAVVSLALVYAVKRKAN